MKRKFFSLRPNDSRLSLFLLLWLTLSGCRANRSLVPTMPCEPRPEACNGMDDDCDGTVDEFSSITCDSKCGTGSRICKNGVLQTCTARLPRPEVCNGKDDDCDGVVDNGNQLPIKFCYDGAPGDLTFANAPCNPGVTRCEQGVEVCRGAIYPTDEICNGLDDNCNGRVDDGAPARDLDIVFVIDNSGSMDDEISNVQGAVLGFRAKYALRMDLRWALVAAPDKNLDKGPLPTVQSDFTNPEGFVVAVNQQTVGVAGTEPTIDAIDMLISSSNPLGLSWKSGAKRAIVVFSDEEPQSVATTETYQSIYNKVANAPGAPLAGVTVFTDMTQVSSLLMWISAAGSGHVKNIYSVNMAVELEKVIVANSCHL